MNVILWLALVPMYADPDGPMYPPIAIEDRWSFGERTREATRNDLQRAYLVRRRCELTEEEIAYWHADRWAVQEWWAYTRWLHRVYDKLDDLTLYEDDETKRLLALTELRRLLGPINYYRGIVPTIPEWEGI